MASKGICQPDRKLDPIPSSLSESQLPHQPMRLTEREPGSQVPMLQRVRSRSIGSWPFSCCTSPVQAQGCWIWFRPQQGSEVKYKQHCQQQDCQVSTDNIFRGTQIVLLLHFCREEGPSESESSSSASIISSSAHTNGLRMLCYFSRMTPVCSWFYLLQLCSLWEDMETLKIKSVIRMDWVLLLYVCIDDTQMF